MNTLRWLSFCIATMLPFNMPSNVLAADFVTTLHKTFREYTPPHDEKNVGLSVITKYEHMEGGRKEAEREGAGKKHDFLVHELGKHGWKENDLAVDDIQAKQLVLSIGDRTKVFVYQCEMPEYPYHSEDMREFFAKIIGKMEECLTYDNNLEGP